MDQEAKNDDDCKKDSMDSLAAMNIVPFLGLMNLLEVRYLHLPEVYRTMLAILCDYDPLSQDNIIKTRRYLSVLLAREPELAQCLLNFLDTPEESTPTSAQHTNATNGSSMEANDNKWQCTPQGLSTQLTEKKPADSLQKETMVVPEQFCSEQVASSLGSEKRDAPIAEYKCFTSTPMSATAQGQTDSQLSSLLTEASVHMSLQSSATDLQASYRDPLSKPVPLVNIYHKDLFASEKSALVVTRSGQPPATQIVLPGCLTTQPSSADPPGLDHTRKSLTAIQHRDQAVFTPNLTPSSTQRQAETTTNSTALLTQVADCSNIKKGKHCSVAQTQTLAISADRASLLYDCTSSTETPPVSVKPSRYATTSSSTETQTMTASASLACTVTQNIRLSKLLGQPSVAYLPAGHFIDNRNSIIGTTANKPPGVEKLQYTSSILSGKMNSASAKLHLLSTQAGNEKCGSLQTGYGKAPNSVTSTSGALSASLPSVQKNSTMKTTMKVISKPGCRKTITLSKILPVLKVDTLTGQDAKMSTMSYDKQVQVGQRQIVKKSKTTGGKEQAYQMYSDAKQLANNSSGQEDCNGKQQLVDWQKENIVFQPTNTKENDPEVRQQEHQKGAQSLSASQHACPTTLPLNLQASKPKPQNISTSLNEQAISGTPTASKPEQMAERSMVLQEHLLAETQKNPKLVCEEDKDRMATSPAMSVAKPTKQQGEHVGSLRSGSSGKQKVQVVAMSMGSSSLSAFPYIQQVVLPDGQVSTIAHNSPAPLDQPVAQLQGAVTSISTAAKPSPTAGVCCTVQERKERPSKSTTQIVLPRSQLKLSVSIQTPTTVNYSSSSQKKLKSTAGHPDSQLKVNKKTAMTETAPTPSAVTTETDLAASCKPAAGKNVLADASNPPPGANNQAKRKRSPSSRRNAAAKTMKLRL